MSRPRLPPEARRLFDQARKSAEGSAPRKHHLVPASYLERWAEEGKVRVTVVDERRSYLSAPTSAARETDYYRLEHPSLNPDEIPPLLVETMLGQLEGTAKRVIDQLLDHGDPDRVPPQELFEFVSHLAFTITRGKHFRDQAQEGLADMYRLYYENFTNDNIRARLRQDGIDPTPDEVAKHREFLDKLVAGEISPEMDEAQVIAHASTAALPLAEHLLDRRWLVYRTPPVLVTCDEPVVILGGPGSPRSERSGVIVAGVAVFPLSPSALLAMFHPDMRPIPPAYLDHVETAEINRDIIAAATRWAFERPSRRTTLGMSVPPAPTQRVIREGPLPVDGAEGELYRTCYPTRWTETHAPPWPVARWWQSGWRHHPFPRLSTLPPGAKVTTGSDGKPPPRARSARTRRRRR